MLSDTQKWMIRWVDTMDYDVDKILSSLSEKVDHSELYIQRNKTTEISLLNDNVNYAKEEDVTGLGIRVINDNRQGFAYTTNIKKLDDVIKQAIKNSTLNSPDENVAIIEKVSGYKKVNGLYDESVEQLNLQDAIKSCQSMINMVKENDCEPTSGEYEISMSETTIANSNDVCVSESQTAMGASISVNTVDDELFSSAYAYDVSHKDEIDLEKIVNEATTLAKDSCGGKSTQTRDTKVILDYFASISLLSTFLSALNSENTQRGRSQFADKLGQQVTNENLSISDDATIEGANRSSMFDDEGTPSEKTELIKDGILNSFVYDTYHANKDEMDVKTTSNAVRSGYSSVPSVGFTNLKFDFKDSTSIDDIGEGIIVHSVMGAHTANPITGDFSVEARNSFEIKNGSIANPIKKAMISGNIFKIMEDAIAIKGESRQVGSCITPKILAKNLRVIG